MGVIHGRTIEIGRLRCEECGCIHTVARSPDGTLRSMEICPGRDRKRGIEEIRDAALNEAISAKKQLNLAIECLADKNLLRALHHLDEATREINTAHGRIRDELLR